MRIFGPFAWPTTSAFTVTAPSASSVAVTASPSTSRSAGRVTRDPGSSPSELTVTTSPTATLYCLPPLRTIAYTRGLLSWSCSGRASPRTRGNGHVALCRGPSVRTGVRVGQTTRAGGSPVGVGSGHRCVPRRVLPRRVLPRRVLPGRLPRAARRAPAAGARGRAFREGVLGRLTVPAPRFGGPGFGGPGFGGHHARGVSRRRHVRGHHDLVDGGDLVEGRGQVCGRRVEQRLLLGATVVGSRRPPGWLDPRRLRRRWLGTRPRPAADASGRLAGRLRRGLRAVGGNLHSPSGAALARFGEGLEQPRAHAFARHLHQPERGHLGDLVLRTVATETLHEPAQHL